MEKKKFLMVTGASGDGKSSLIFAGLLPNIRAGFFKAQFAHWKAAIFRPGNDPLHNLAVNVAEQLNIENYDIVKASLSLGYSALVDMYKNSDFYNNDSSEGIKKSANLLIVADQFEEFFTNKENFNRETAIPSQTAQTVINLLLETTKIAKAENLPIYIVCTMRSDYIGSATTFRGLPEIIGDNQFFVPRLNREEILQAITEPAVLSGSKISIRLAQQLMNDLNMINIDVLPVLQHALHRIWLMADDGREELDISHYSAVGGFNKSDLPDDQLEAYQAWYLKQPKYLKSFYKNQKTNFNQNLNNVLNHHANILFAFAHLRYNENHEDEITETDAQLIIENAFKSLTKIDDSKAVRNRATIQEITDVIAKPEIDVKKVVEVLNIFRDPDNTLIFPFITDDEKSKKLKSNTLLDITHESLIRNWRQLSMWAQEEYENASVFRELKPQVERWIEEDRSNKHLLSAGPFAYYQKWFTEKRPSPIWITKYIDVKLYKTDGVMKSSLLKEGTKKEQRDSHGILESHKTYNHIKEYLKGSKNQIQKVQRIRRAVMGFVTVLFLVTAVALYFNKQLQQRIELTARADRIATKASMTLENDPTLSFRLAEQAYNLHPTELSRQVLMASYGKFPFYYKLHEKSRAVELVKYDPKGKYICTTAGNGITIWSPTGKKTKELEIDLVSDLTASPNAFNISNNGELIAGCAANSSVMLWNNSGKKIKVFQGHANAIVSVVFSPDDKRIVTGSRDHTARIWEIGNFEMTILSGHEEPLKSAKFSPDGKMILTISLDNTARMWNLNGKEISRLNDLFLGNIADGNFSPDGKYVVITSYDNDARLWQWETGELTLLKGHTDVIWSARFSPTGKYILTGSIDNTARLWDYDGNPVTEFTGHTAKLWDAKFSKDGTKVITASDDATAKVWRLDGKVLHTLKGHASQVYCVDFSPDGNYAITAANDATVRIWNIVPKENPVLKEHFSWVDDAKFSPDGQTIVTTGYDYSARLWNANGHFQKQLLGYTNYGVYSASFSNNGEYILTTSRDYTVRIWNIKGEPVTVIQTPKVRLNTAAFSPDSRFIITSSSSQLQLVHIWDLKGTMLKEFKNSIDYSFSPNGKFLAIASNEKAAYIYKIRSEGGSMSLILEYSILDHSDDNLNIRFSPESNYLITQTRDSITWLWSLDEKRDKPLTLVKRINYKTGSISFLNFSQNNQYFMATSANNVGLLYNMKGELISELTGHLDRITFAEFSSDGKHIVTASSDFTIRIWDLQGNELQVLSNHTAAVEKVHFSNDGKFILSCSNDQTARLTPWRVEDVLKKIDIEKVRGEVWQLSEEDKKLYGIISP